MEPAFARFQIGAFDCASLLDGSMDYPIQSMYANVSRQEVEAALRQRNLPVEIITTPYSYLYVHTEDRHILVDVGAGDLGPNTGNLLQSLREMGVSPEDIDVVIISHAHPDHIGGMLDDQGKPIYTHAQYYISREEWSFWFSEGAAAKTNEHFIEAARKALVPIRDRVTLVDQETEILPGVRIIPAPGHTPGHRVALFQSGNQALMYIGDTVLQPLHLEHIDWLPIYDILPKEAMASKKRIFDLVANEHYLILGQHFPPFPGLGFVSKHEKGWTWTPFCP